jgi:hypothetical protein
MEYPGHRGNLQVACLGPIYVQGPTEWTNCSLRVCRHPKGFEITDEDAGVNIIAEGVEITENLRPLNAFTTAEKNS